MSDLSVQGSVYAGAPRNLDAVAGDTVVNLSWSASHLAESYRIYRGTTSGFALTSEIAETGALTYQDTGRTNGVTYYYVVTAVIAGIESQISVQDSAIPAP